jgi:molecular chaperone DnaJ
VRVRTLERCAECRGSGAREGTRATACDTCGGSGEVRRSARSMFGQFLAVSACPACGGEGTVIRDRCPHCQGEGRVRAEKTVQLDVPAGVADHHYLTIRGGGVPGPRNGPPGDLVAVLEIEEDPRFERHGDDLVYDLPISYAQAALGAEVKVPTPFGESVLKLHPGTQTGTVHRVRGKGLPRLGSSGHGDLHVRVRVWTPTHLSAEQKAVFEQLARVETAPPADARAGRKFWDEIRRAFGA